MTGFTAWAFKTLAVGGVSVASACCVRRACSRAAPGLPRFIAVLPILIQFTLTPLIFDKQTELLSRAFSAAILLWLANFKVLLLVLNRGPLCDPTLSLGQFVALLLWPLLHKQGPDGHVMRFGETHPSSVPEGNPVIGSVPRMAARRSAALRRLVFRLPENLVITVVGGRTLTDPRVPLFLKTYSAAFSVSCFCDIFANAAAALVIYLCDLDIAMSWNRPWLQNCLSDFWSRRWNLAAAYSLRALVYEPLIEGAWVKKQTSTTKATDSQPIQPPAGPEDVKDKSNADLAPAEAPSPPRGPVAPPATPGDGGAQTYAAALKQDTSSANTTVQEDSSNELRMRRLHAAPHDNTGRTHAFSNGGPSPPGSSSGRKRVSSSQRLVALATVFAVSGVMHEVLLLLCTGWAAYHRVAGWQMVYFMLQVPASVVEQVLSKSFTRARWTPPNWLAIPFTSLSLQIPGLILFWNPIFNAATWAMEGTAK